MKLWHFSHSRRILSHELCSIMGFNPNGILARLPIGQVVSGRLGTSNEVKVRQPTTRQEQAPLRRLSCINIIPSCSPQINSTRSNAPRTTMSEEFSFGNDRVISLQSREGDSFDLPAAAAAAVSQLVKDAMDDPADDEEIIPCPLPRVSTDCLRRIVDFMNHHHKEPMDPIPTPLNGNTFEEVGVVSRYCGCFFVFVHLI